MVRIKTLCQRVLPVILLSSLTACSWLDKTFPDKAEQYKRAKPAKSLEIPPDLTTTPTSDGLVVPTTLSGYTSAQKSQNQAAGGTNTVLPTGSAAKFERDGEQAWLVIEGMPASIWTRAREFWIENGFLITREDPKLGTLETDWVENRAAIPQGPIRRLISRVYENAYSSAYRDRYRMRLERGAKPGTTELFITHQGIEEVLSDSDDEGGSTKWGPRPPDPGMESEILKRMMIFLGTQPAEAKQQVAEATPKPKRAELVQQGSGLAALVVHGNFDQAWRDVGIVLDRVGFAVEDRDRLQGLYYVRYNDPLKGDEHKGFLSSLAFWSGGKDKPQRYRIKLSDGGADTRIVVLDAEGKPETSVTAVRILNLLYDELK